MIIEDKHWILIIFSDFEAFEKKARKIGGKWLTFGPREVLHRYINLIATLVEEGEFIAAEITNKTPGIFPFRREDCVIHVYTSANEEEKEKTRRRLVGIGLTPHRWKSEEKISKGWFPGGKWRPAHKTVEKKPELSFRDIRANELNLRHLSNDFPTSASTEVEPSQEEKAPEEKRTKGKPDSQHLPLSAPVPPFQLDWLEPRLIDANGRPFVMSPKLHDVLKVMLSREPGGPRIIRGFLSDRTVASLFEGKEIDDPREAKRIARNFARNLRKTFKKHGLNDRNALIERKIILAGFAMGHGWRSERPLINQAEVPLFFRDDLDGEPEDSDED